MTTIYGHMEIPMNIPAGVFKAQCLKLMEQVEKTRQPVVITKHGRPVAQLAPVPPAAGRAEVNASTGSARRSKVLTVLLSTGPRVPDRRPLP